MVTNGPPIVSFPPKKPPGKRFFVIDGREFPDPDPAMTIDQVREHFVDFFPELANCETKTVKRGDDDVTTFTKRVGTKGSLLTVHVVVGCWGCCLEVVEGYLQEGRAEDRKKALCSEWGIDPTNQSEYAHAISVIPVEVG